MAGSGSPVNQQILSFSKYLSFNSFLKNVSILYPLKTENLSFSGPFRGYKMGTLAQNGIKQRHVLSYGVMRSFSFFLSAVWHVPPWKS